MSHSVMLRAWSALMLSGFLLFAAGIWNEAQADPAQQHGEHGVKATKPSAETCCCDTYGGELLHCHPLFCEFMSSPGFEDANLSHHQFSYSTPPMSVDADTDYPPPKPLQS